MLETECKEISKKGIIAVRKDEGTFKIEAETIVIAIGSKGNNGEFATLESVIPLMIKIGDCVEPRGILEAIDEGHHAGFKI